MVWLPRAGPAAAGDPTGDADDSDRIAALISRAVADLRAELAFIRCMPTTRSDMRRFCALPIALALLTLRRLSVRAGFSSRAEIKVSRRNVARLVAYTRAHATDDSALEGAFEYIAASISDGR